MANYKCGDIVRVKLSGTGHIQTGERYGVIVSNNVGNQNAPIYTLVPFTTRRKNLKQPTHCFFSAGEGGLPMASMLLGEQLIPINKEDVLGKVGEFNDWQMEQVAIAIAMSIPVVLKAFKANVHQTDIFRKISS
ncbi:type II toxin-antitoxin system PemK/MazF family toxin [Butyricicoccus sp. 1XD8-22]|nr:type II toxin-antitoxin system PemK/MazF family toxin [Butyricicoccus sp. 1XD8-22]